MADVKKSNLISALEATKEKETELERILATLDCVRGYKNEYDQETEKPQSEGFQKCKREFNSQVEKIKEWVKSNY